MEKLFALKLSQPTEEIREKTHKVVYLIRLSGQGAGGLHVGPKNQVKP
jgi:hypothetical protein